MKLLIKSGYVINPETKVEGKLDIYVEDGKISKIDKNIKCDDNDIDVIDAQGKIIVPGLVDMHCHLRDPGYEYKEDIESGTKSAAAGGFTSVACMPNTNPVIDNKTVVEYILSKAAKVGSTNVFPIGAITKGLMGKELAEIGELKSAGAVAVSDDGKPVSNSCLMRRAMQYAKGLDTLIISHCEDLNLVDGGVMNEGYISTYLGLRGITKSAEEAMVARDVILAKDTGARVHIAHVSTKGSIDIVRNAKKKGINVTCETCPHYFSLTDEAVKDYDTNAKVNPPLRNNEDVEAVKQGLSDSTIDAIATDHAPHHIDEKNVEFDVASNGMIGFETALSLGITYLVDEGVISMEELVRKMTINPSKILGIDKGTLEIGKSADIVIFDKDKKYKVDKNKFMSKSKNSPFDGLELKGKVYCTIVEGKITYMEK